MNYTKGEWRVGESFDNGQEYPIYASDGYELARVYIHNGEQIANAYLIVTAVNACIKLNPNNPIAVAESIEGMYEVCQYLATNGWNAGVSEQAKEVLAKAEGKND